MHALWPGDVVVMDNLSLHKNPGTVSLLEQAEMCIRFLPPYSPDFNPIESLTGANGTVKLAVMGNTSLPLTKLQVKNQLL